VVTLRGRMSASGSRPAGVCPGGAEVVRRMAAQTRAFIDGALGEDALLD
jgi:hypothetical protein